MRFANRVVKTIKPYKVSSPKAWEYVGDQNVLKLDWNESTIGPSPRVYEAITNTFSQNRWNWYPNINNTELIRAISVYCNLPESNVQFFAGSDALHEYIVRCFISHQDRILSISPTYDNFRAVVEANGGNVYQYSLDNRFLLDYDKLDTDLELIDPKIVYLVNPNNPTGTFHSIEKLSILIKKHVNILFIIDEAYFEFTNKSIAYLTIECDNLIVSRTFSKAFGLASFRIGYCAAHSTIIDSLNKIRNPKSVSLFAQEAARSALIDLEYMQNYVREVNASKLFVFDELTKIKWIEPFWGEGNYLFLRIESNKLEGFLSFLESKKVFLRDYSHMKNTVNFVRLTIGLKEQMSRVLDCINEFDK